jgi:hypothetical protein
VVERRIFVSVNRDSILGVDERRRGIKQAVLDRLATDGYAPQLFYETGLPVGMAWNFNNVIAVMRRCVGAIVLGFPRWRMTINGNPNKLIGEFSHIEGPSRCPLGCRL